MSLGVMVDLTAGGDTFRIEAEDCLAAMEQGLDALATGDREPELVHTIFRAAHTLKGAALVVGRKDVGELARPAFTSTANAVIALSTSTTPAARRTSRKCASCASNS